MSDDVKHLLWLSQTLSPTMAWYAYSAFGSAEAVYNATLEDYQAKPFLKANHQHFLCNKSMAVVEQILSDCEKQSIGILTPEDSRYPRLLREIAVPPLTLFFRGTLPDFDSSFLVAMAGTRHCSSYGMRVAARLGQLFTENGLTVVTGMALGCDHAALTAALDAGGPVGALVVGGLDQPFYPTDDCRALYQRVAERGFLLSEYAPGTPPHNGMFRMRNRLLSGIANCLLCVEGGRTSGTMQVADYAAEQGREIFAVPGRLDTVSAIGTNELIQSGVATLLLHPNDIFDLARRENPELFLRDGASSPAQPETPAESRTESASDAPSPAAPLPSSGPSAAKNSEGDTQNSQKKVDSPAPSAYIDLETLLAGCTAAERSCYLALSPTCSTPDQLAAQCNLSVSEVNTALTMLTLRGLVTEPGEGRFSPATGE